MYTGIIILAAGNSSRMGKPKQLLTFQGKTLLEIVSAEAVKTGFKPVVVVLGAYAEQIAKQHQHQDITYLINKDWHQGMSSSIVAGLTEMLQQHQPIENVIIAVADQVFIKAAHFEGLLAKHKLTTKNIITSTYAQTSGTPTLFNKKYFEQLLSLAGAKGAKNIIKQHMDDTDTISFEMGHLDIDTETDYDNLIKHT